MKKSQDLMIRFGGSTPYDPEDLQLRSPLGKAAASTFLGALGLSSHLRSTTEGHVRPNCGCSRTMSLLQGGRLGKVDVPQGGDSADGVVVLASLLGRDPPQEVLALASILLASKAVELP